MVHEKQYIAREKNKTRKYRIFVAESATLWPCQAVEISSTILRHMFSRWLSSVAQFNLISSLHPDFYMAVEICVKEHLFTLEDSAKSTEDKSLGSEGRALNAGRFIGDFFLGQKVTVTSCPLTSV